MKICPKCKTEYDDMQNFCIQDGCGLIDKPTDSQQSSDNYKQEKHEPKKNGCLKKFIFGTIIIIIGVVVLFNYLSNAATYLRTEPNYISASKAGGTCKVDIDYDGYIWTINHKPNWVEINENDNDFELAVRPNDTGLLREGTITIQSGKFLAQVMVKQNGYATFVKSSDTSVKFGKTGGTKDVFIETDGYKWEAKYTNWMSVNKESESKLHIKCPNNTGEYRTGTITVKEDNAVVVINVTQSGDCNNCHGNGEISCNSCSGMGGVGFGMYYSSCMWCGGNGKVTCGLCGGRGIIE